MEDDGARMVLSVGGPGTMAAAAAAQPGWAAGDGPLAVQELVTGGAGARHGWQAGSGRQWVTVCMASSGLGAAWKTVG